MQRVKELTPRGTHQTLEDAIANVNKWYVGWSSYYSMTQYPAQLKKIEAHIRRRLRARLVDQQKSSRNLYKKLMKRGVRRGTAWGAIYLGSRKRWALSHTHAVERAFPNRWFIEDVGQAIRSNENQPHWFSVNTWVRLT